MFHGQRLCFSAAFRKVRSLAGIFSSPQDFLPCGAGPSTASATRGLVLSSSGKPVSPPPACWRGNKPAGSSFMLLVACLVSVGMEEIFLPVPSPGLGFFSARAYESPVWRQSRTPIRGWQEEMSMIRFAILEGIPKGLLPPWRRPM